MDWSHRVYSQKQKLLIRYIVALATLSLSLFVMPFANDIKRVTKIPMCLDGALFWLSAYVTVRTAVKINNARRNNIVFNKKYSGLKKLALIHFFQNKPAWIMDSLMFGSLVMVVISKIREWDIKIQFLLIAIFVFSFGMHCMLNGINYIYIRYKSTVRRG